MQAEDDIIEEKQDKASAEEPELTVPALQPVSEAIAALPTEADIEVCIANAKVARVHELAAAICEAQRAGYAAAGTDCRPDTPHGRRVMMDGVADYLEQTIALQCGTTSDLVEEAIDMADKQGAYIAAHVARVMLTICGR